ncbi:hypothetical protein FZEAL_2140 [Fusarium zealandicum]|uniref:DUF6546 domain-containing protein n=1 Tax=Fusarium zealandicum TaxID=1053134 RepID=A0A8H4UR81_9HYPO|nr:hypothetical protein FZEAL_2140 [Fusarium zealandicum]
MVNWLIRNLVLEAVAENYSLQDEPYARIGYATFCREWYSFFVPKMSKTNFVDQNRVVDFDIMTISKRQFIRREISMSMTERRHSALAGFVKAASYLYWGKLRAAEYKQLENFSSAFLVHAEHFFANFGPDIAAPNAQPWPHLRTLALTSYWVYQPTEQQRVEDVPISAARAAELMPVLETMEIWNGTCSKTCLFQHKY